MSTADETKTTDYGFHREGLFEQFAQRAWDGMEGVQMGLVPMWDQVAPTGRARFRGNLRTAFALAVLDLPANRTNTRANLLWFADLQPKEG